MHPLFSGVPADLKEQLLAEVEVRKIERGEPIFLHGDVLNSFFIVADGWVKLYRETLGGEESIIDILTRGALLGEALLMGERSLPFNAEAVDQVMLLAFPLSLMREKVQESHKLSLNLLKEMAGHKHQLVDHIEHLSIQNAPQRIGCFLLRLCMEEESNSASLELPFDKSLLAAKLGMKPETFSRALKNLGKVGVAVEGKTVSIRSVPELSDYCCASCSNMFPCQDLM